MRVVVLFAAVAVGVLLWIALRPEPRGAAQRGKVPTPAETPAPPSSPARVPATAADLLHDLGDGEVSEADCAAVESFRRRWVAQGAAAVAEIQSLLSTAGGTLPLAAWSSGEESEHPPTLRAACILALAQIPGPEATDALAGVVSGAVVPGEAFLAARELARRGTPAWAAGALDQATRDAEPAQEYYQAELVKLAAGSDPSETARRLLHAAPRNDEQRDPGCLARALQYLPWPDAVGVAPGILEEDTVTLRAKRRYAEALLARPEAEVVRLIRDSWERVGRSPALRDVLAEALVRADAWKGKGARADECRALLKDFYPVPEAAPGPVRRILRELEGR